MSTHPKRADHFREWSKMMLEQAIVPDRLQYKGASSTKKPTSQHMKAGLAGQLRKRRRRRRRRKRQGKGD